MTYNKTKPSRKNKFLQNNDFLFVWNAKELSFCHKLKFSNHYIFATYIGITL